MCKPHWQNLRNRSYFSEDTVFALATPLGGALAVVRVSGKTLIHLKEVLFLAELLPRQCQLVYVRDLQKKRLDQAMAVWFPAPKSFTGEDVLELFLHPSPFLIKRLFQCFQALGLRQALPGEFSFRAVRNGKMSLLQAQAVLDLCSAQNEKALFLAHEKLLGKQNQVMQELGKKLRSVLKKTEIELDFSDQEVGCADFEHLKQTLVPIQNTLSHLAQSFQKGSWIQKGIPTVIVGAPNVGKSSLFNTLLGEDRALVSALSGTTRDVLSQTLTLTDEGKTVSFHFLDTAGLRTKVGRIEALGIEKTKKTLQEAAWVLFLLDPFQKKQKTKALWDQLGLGKSKKQVFLIGTKSDLMKIKLFEKKKQRFFTKWTDVLSVPKSQRFLCSSKTEEGMAELISGMVQHAEKHLHPTQNENVLYLTRADQYACVQKAKKALFKAQKAWNWELFAASIREALSHLALFLGETMPEQVLNQIFSEYCIGK